MNASGQTVWENCLVYIKDNIQDQAYKTWFEPIIPVKLENKVLSIQVPSKFFYEWLMMLDLYTSLKWKIPMVTERHLRKVFLVTIDPKWFFNR